nr:MAG TPA: hypothetical protein [Caudoviricetes sp.]
MVRPTVTLASDCFSSALIIPVRSKYAIWLATAFLTAFLRGSKSLSKSLYA